MPSMNQNELAAFLAANGYPKFRADSIASFLVSRLNAGNSVSDITLDLESPPPAGLGLANHEASSVAKAVMDEWQKPAPPQKGDKGDKGDPGHDGKHAAAWILWTLGTAAAIAIAIGLYAFFNTFSVAKLGNERFEAQSGEIKKALENTEIVRTDTVQAINDSAEAKKKAEEALAKANSVLDEAKQVAKNEAASVVQDFSLQVADAHAKLVERTKKLENDAATQDDRLANLESLAANHEGRVQKLEGDVARLDGSVVSLGKRTSRNEKFVKDVRTGVVVIKPASPPPVAAAAPQGASDINVQFR